jgi:hypothetical protein
MAETELGILHRPCLARRLDDPAVIREDVEAWEAERNGVQRNNATPISLLTLSTALVDNDW